MIRKIPIPPPASIVDKDYEALLDDDEDEVFILASQSTEEKFIQQRQMVSEQLNYSHNLAYNCFSSNAAGTSTQYLKTGFTEQIQQNLFEDFTAPSQVTSSQRNGAPTIQKSSQAFVPPPISNPSVRPPLQVKAVPPKFPNAPVGSSQKENISTQQELTKQRNQIRALEIQLKNSKESVAELNLKSMDKNGEIAYLRKEKKNLEEKILKLRENDTIKVDPEKSRLRKENLDLKTKLKFKSLNESSILKPPSTVQQLEPTTAATFTNFNIESSSPFQPIASKIFEVEEPLENRDEPVIIALEREASYNVVKTQLKLARVYSNLLIGGVIDEAVVDSLFNDAACMILHIADFIEYLEAGEEDEIIFDSDVALTACSFISIPCFREKLTDFDPLLNTLDKFDGNLSVLQAEKLYPEELCAKPRRIIAIYAALARNSRKFSEKLLLDNVLSDDSDCFRTFVSVLVDSLLSGVTESKNVFDYFGLTIACASLLASLGSHYNEYSSNNIIDDILFRLFRAVLECRCDSPILMDHLSEFLVHITKNSRRTEMANRLCVNFPSSQIDISKAYKYSQYPFEACAFHLFSSYLLSAFKFDCELNRHELELLLKITQNLNCVVSNIKEMPVGTFCFLYWTDQQIPLCSCFYTLTYAILTLNYLALANRNKDFKQIVPVSTIVDPAAGLPKLKKESEFNERKSNDDSNHYFVG